MKINRQEVLHKFQEYVGIDVAENSELHMQMEHSVKVAELCEQIATDIAVEKEDVDLAWLAGLLHDIGTMEQLKNKDAVKDITAFNRGQYSAAILFGDSENTQGALIREFIVEATEDALLHSAIFWHCISSGLGFLDERTRKICYIVGEADIIDNLRINAGIPLEERYHVTTDELYGSQISEDVLYHMAIERAAMKHKCQTPVDRLVADISTVFELAYSISLRIVSEQGYLYKLMDFQSRDAETQKNFGYICERIQKFIDKELERKTV